MSDGTNPLSRIMEDEREEMNSAVGYSGNKN
jgi:hypothetical protein